jgi:hypothetical protein
MDEREMKDRGYTIKIEQDPEPQNPRTDWDNFGKMVAFHPRYDLGDKSDMKREELLKEIAKKDVVALPLYLYDHSGLAIRTSRFMEDPGGWDTSFVGYIYATPAMIKKEYGKVTPETIAKAKEVLQGEVTNYDAYLSGDVYGYTVTDPRGNVIDSCWGFFESDGLKEARSQANSAVDADLEHKRKGKAPVKSVRKSKKRTFVPRMGMQGIH